MPAYKPCSPLEASFSCINQLLSAKNSPIAFSPNQLNRSLSNLLLLNTVYTFGISCEFSPPILDAEPHDLLH